MAVTIHYVRRKCGAEATSPQYNGMHADMACVHLQTCQTSHSRGDADSVTSSLNTHALQGTRCNSGCGNVEVNSHVFLPLRWNGNLILLSDITRGVVNIFSATRIDSVALVGFRVSLSKEDMAEMTTTISTSGFCKAHIAT